MHSPEITFSVIIPNFNNGDTLGRAIASVLSQTFPAMEIIVIDDGSTDHSAQVAAQFGDRVRYVYRENAGVSAARNHGAKLATGKWLAFLDADDTYMPNRLEAHATWLAREPDIDFLFGDQEYRDHEGTFLQMAIDASAGGRMLLQRHPGVLDIPILPDDFEALIADGFSEIRTLSIPHATFHALGGFPVDRKIGEDLFFFIRLFIASRKGGVVNMPLAVYYIYPTSALRKNIIASQHAFINTLGSLFADLSDAAPGVRRGWRAKLRQARLSLAYMYLRANNKGAALKSVLPLLKSDPSLRSLRDLASIVRGLP
jgi:glycosyltransferase involved in cell wall biosynthesis